MKTSYVNRPESQVVFSDVKFPQPERDSRLKFILNEIVD
jgi:hypothetical protein